MSDCHLGMSLPSVRHRVSTYQPWRGPCRGSIQGCLSWEWAALQGEPEVNSMSSLFQTERTSPYCARKCFCPGGGAMCHQTCSYPWDSYQNLG